MPSRVNFYEEEFDKLVTDRGQNCLWEQAVVCNCVSKDTFQPDFECKICKGTGYRYISPKKIIVIVSNQSGKYDLNSLQLRESGTSFVTPRADVIMGFRDRLTFIDYRCKFSEVIHWGKNSKKSPTLHKPINEVLFLADSKYEYEAGIDFKISEDSYHLEWINEDYLKNMSDRRLSILYYTTPTYLVDDLLHELRGTLSDRKSRGQITFRELPKQYKVVREYFTYNIKPNDGEEPKSEEGVLI